MPCVKRSGTEAGRRIGQGRPRRLSGGFSIVEALIALVLLFAALISIAGLYIHSLRAGSNALLRTRAAHLAAEIAQCIRANPTAGTAYASGQPPAGAVADCSKPAARCTAVQQAAADLARWERQLVAALPDADDNAATPQWSITVRGKTLPRTYVITIYWLAPGAKTPLSYVLSVTA